MRERIRDLALLGLFFIPTAALAFEPTSLWVKSVPGDAVRVIDPQRTSAGGSPVPVELKLAADTEISEPFLLNAEGGRYSPGKGQKPFQLGGKPPYAGIYVGFDYPGVDGPRILAIHLDDVSRAAPRGRPKFARTPVLGRTPAEAPGACARAAGSPGTGVGADDIARALDGARCDPSSERDDLMAALELVRQFHNEDCEKLRSPDPRDSSAEKEISGLKAEWAAFIARRAGANPRLAKRLTLARDLDFIARTATLEGHVPGMLERGGGGAGASAGAGAGAGGNGGGSAPAVSPAVCTDASPCPITACEGRIIALSIVNRGRNPACRIFGCSGPDDFTGVATEPGQYNIWKPGLNHKDIATCFLRDGVLGGDDVPSLADYRNRARQFRAALESAGRILARPESEWGIRAVGGSASIDRFLNYFHPGGMDGCDPETYEHRYRLHAAYLRSDGATPDYDLAFGRTVYVPVAAAPAGDVLADFVDGTGKRAYADPARRKWWLPAGELRERDRVKTSQPCVAGGLPALALNARACDGQSPGRAHQVPRWSFDAGVESMQFTCSFPGRPSVTLGGPCDTRMQPLGKVRH